MRISDWSSDVCSSDLDLARELSERAARIDAGEVGLKKLEQEVAAARRRYEQAAIVLREARVKAAEGLDAADAGELKPLKPDSARFRTGEAPLHQPQWSAAGRDRVGFELSTTPGAPCAQLTEIPVGGAPSPYTLALQVT